MFRYIGPLSEVSAICDGLNTAAKNGLRLPRITLFTGDSMSWAQYYYELVQYYANQGVPARRQWKGKSPKGSTRWAKRHQTGEIVCSEYFRYDIKATATARKELGTVVLYRHPPTYVAFHSPDLRIAKGYFPQETWYPHRIIKGSWAWRDIPEDRYSYVKNTTFVEWPDGSVGNAAYFPAVWGSLETVDGIVYDRVVAVGAAAIPDIPFNPTLNEAASPEAILEVANKLKEGEADLLTELAEMHKTATGLALNIARVLQYMRDIKGHTVKAASYAALQVAEPHLGSVRSYQRLLRREARRYRKNVKRMNQKYGSDGSGKAVDRLTNHWLDSQYGIGPMLYLIQDQIENLRETKRAYIRARARYNEVVHVDIPDGWTVVTNTLAVKHCVWGKAALGYDTLYQQLRSYYTGNLLNTAWELYPFSFAYDWVTKLGSVLSSIDFDAQHVQTVFTHSSTLTGELVIEKKDQEGNVTTVTYSGFGYRRSFVQPEARYLSLANPLKWDLSWKNFLSALSLAWQGARGKKLEGHIKDG